MKPDTSGIIKKSLDDMFDLAYGIGFSEGKAQGYETGYKDGLDKAKEIHKKVMDGK